jgi:hypothetical protein
VKHRRLAIAALLAATGALHAPGAPRASFAPTPLPPREKLTYSIEFGMIRAGTATLEIREPRETLDAARAIEIVSRARSSPFFSHFYPVDDEVKSLVDSTTFLPIRFEKRLSEGSYRANEAILFDRAAGRARYASGDVVAIPPGARDVLSAFYEVRRLRPQPGDSVVFLNHTGRKTMTVQVRVLAREMIETRVGRFRCIKTEPVITRGGLFKNQGRLWIWFTDDARMVPVRMESKITFGSIVAAIERIERPDFNAAASRRPGRDR